MIDIEKIFSIKADGVVDLLINSCTKLNFCLPHLAYKITEKNEQTKFVEVIFDVDWDKDSYVMYHQEA